MRGCAGSAQQNPAHIKTMKHFQTEQDLAINRLAQQLRDCEAYDEQRELNAILPTDAQERKAIPVYTCFMRYFPRAIVAVTKISQKGREQHCTDGWDRSKSADDKDALMRHVLEGDWARVAWRAIAVLEKHLEEQL